MIYVGFGFLMVFLKLNSWSSVGFTYLVACWAVQLNILFTGFWEQVAMYYSVGPDYVWHKIDLSLENLFLAEFGAGAVLITYGALLGKIGLFQLWILAVIEMFFFCLNEAILAKIFKVNDVGGSMVIHMFGAYFGLAAALFYQPVAAIKDKKGLGVNSYWSDLVSMIGTLFLFAFWPSFNGGLVTGSHQMRTAISTYICMAGSVLGACVFSKMTHGGKLEMEIILNSSIAGGVAAGSLADLVVLPFGILLLGFIAGGVSAFGYAYLGKFLQRTINLHDTCGVHNLHGMPGLISALTTAIIASRIE